VDDRCAQVAAVLRDLSEAPLRRSQERDLVEAGDTLDLTQRPPRVRISIIGEGLRLR